MQGHFRRERGDGNGFPGGVRLSWPAIGALVAVGGLAIGIGDRLWCRTWSTGDASATASGQVATNDAVVGMETRIRLHLDRVELKLDALQEALHNHAMNANAHHPADE